MSFCVIEYSDKKGGDEMKLTASAASLRDPGDSEEFIVATEEAPYCDGSDCGAACFSEDGELELLAPHWHVIEKGWSPEAGPRCYLIW
jgi:hypothetical protein